jgi:hypothetical protein
MLTVTELLHPAPSPLGRLVKQAGVDHVVPSMIGGSNGVQKAARRRGATVAVAAAGARDRGARTLRPGSCGRRTSTS